ncbi:MAG TPA: hypothetical protein VHD35_09805 [Chitinophagaceae bacterium]|nr:hypothetical protein [Chitinophagaceae bacterium]
MIINRHNYDEYFILYMDNELGSEERRQVEVFVQQNPDLKEELELLLQSKFTPESHIVFENKEDLFRVADSAAINMSNYVEWLMLYLDDELTAEENILVENFIASHSAVKTELDILAKTKLQPEENIVFPDKELLYRKTEKVRVVQISWWRVAAAAILILGIGISTVFIWNNRKPSVSGPTAAQEIKDTNNATDQSAARKNLIDQTNPSLADNEKKNQVTNETIKQQPIKTVVTKSGENILAVQKNIPAKLNEPLQKEMPLIADNMPTNNLPSPINNPNATIKESSSVPNVAINEVPDKLTTNQIETAAVTNAPDKPYINTAASEKTDPVYASQQETDNKKTRGFFRKVTRLFEKTTKINPADDDDRVLIGAVAVKLR